MCFETLFFDLDDTLYPSNAGLWEAIRQRIDRYMVEKLQIREDVVSELRKELFLKHGTTMRGLQARYQIDEQDFLDYVHNVPLVNYLKPDPLLRSTLEAYPQRKVIFTNADTNHANRVIFTLGLEGCFDQIIDIRDIRPFCKPQLEAFKKALEIACVQNPSECVMIDDSIKNLQSASEAGLFTIHIGTADCPPGIDASILSLAELPSVIPVNGAL
jgi:putative hydrolase of the HAD superfamily